MSQVKKAALSELSSRVVNGENVRIGIVHTKWNREIVDSLVSGAKNELLANKVQDENIVIAAVSGAYELPYAASRLIHSQNVDAVICIGCLIKGETMHFEYISEAVTQGIMKLNLDTGVPVIYGVLACLNEEQARARAGLTPDSHNHGVEWAQTSIEMANLKENTEKKLCPFRVRQYFNKHCPFKIESKTSFVVATSIIGSISYGVFQFFKK